MAPSLNNGINGLSWVEFGFNTNYNESTQTTPFKALCGREPPTLIKGDMAPSKVEDVNQMIIERNLMQDELKWQLAKAQNRINRQTKREGK